MKARLLSFAIKLLLRYIDFKEEYTETLDNEKSRNFLSTLYTHPHFEQYFKRRNNLLMQELSGGSGFAERTRDDYIRMLGQRFELLILAAKAKKAYESKKLEMRRAHDKRMQRNPQ